MKTTINGSTVCANVLPEIKIIISRHDLAELVRKDRIAEHHEYQLKDDTIIFQEIVIEVTK